MSATELQRAAVATHSARTAADFRIALAAAAALRRTILAQAVYVYHFWVELVHLIEAAFGDADALNVLIKSVGYQLPHDRKDGVVVGSPCRRS